jgi:hypothetical protein
MSGRGSFRTRPDELSPCSTIAHAFDDLARRMAESQGKPFDASAEPERLLAEAEDIGRRLANRVVVLGVFGIVVGVISVVIACVVRLSPISFGTTLASGSAMTLLGASVTRAGLKLRRRRTPRL